MTYYLKNIRAFLLITFLFSVGCEKGYSSKDIMSQGDMTSLSCLSHESLKFSGQTGIQVFVNQKVQIAEKNLVAKGGATVNHLVAPSYFQLDENSPLSVMINHNCVAEAEKDGYSQRILMESDIEPQTQFQVYSVAMSEGMNYAELKELVEADSCIIGVSNEEQFHVDLTQTLDPNLDGQQDYLTPINAKKAWEISSDEVLGAKEDVVVAVLDTGVDYKHEDLKNQMWSKDGVFGHDSANNDSDPMDDHGHGTMVSGFIGAEADNGVGIKGLFSSHTKIMAVKVLNSQGSGSSTHVANGIIWATDNGAEIINLSLGGQSSRGTDPMIDSAVEYALNKNVVIINAAGNSGLDVAKYFVWPANNGEKPGFVVVAATDAPQRKLASFSNHNSRLVHIAAPGSSVENWSGLLTTKPGNKYGRAAGTSFSSPIVAGAASMVLSLIKSRGDGYTNDYIESLLMDSATKVAGLEPYVKDGNYLNVSSLMSLASDKATVVIVEQPKAQNVVVNDPLNLMVVTSGGESPVFQWFKNGDAIYGANSSDYSIPTAGVESAGSYHVEITSSFGTVSKSTEVEVKVFSSLCI